jgi:hypothetical protein
MMPSSRYRDFLQVLYAASIQAAPTAADLRRLAGELRRGRLGDELAYMLEQVSSHFEEPQSWASDETRVIEKIMKDRKIPKMTLVNVIRSIDAEAFSLAPSDTIRDILQAFTSVASATQIQKLRDTLLASGRSDAFIKGISTKR